MVVWILTWSFPSMHHWRTHPPGCWGSSEEINNTRGLFTASVLLLKGKAPPPLSHLHLHTHQRSEVAPPPSFEALVSQRPCSTCGVFPEIKAGFCCSEPTRRWKTSTHLGAQLWHTGFFREFICLQTVILTQRYYPFRSLLLKHKFMRYIHPMTSQSWQKLC